MIASSLLLYSDLSRTTGKSTILSVAFYGSNVRPSINAGFNYILEELYFQNDFIYNPVLDLSDTLTKKFVWPSKNFPGIFVNA